MEPLTPVDGKCQRIIFVTRNTLNNSFAFDKTQYTAVVFNRCLMIKGLIQVRILFNYIIYDFQIAHSKVIENKIYTFDSNNSIYKICSV